MVGVGDGHGDGADDVGDGLADAGVRVAVVAQGAENRDVRAQGLGAGGGVAQPLQADAHDGDGCRDLLVQGRVRGVAQGFPFRGAV